MTDNKYKRLGINTMLVFLGNIGPKLVSLILMPFYTFWMSMEEFGIQDIILTYSVLLIPFFCLGLYEAVFVLPKGKDRLEQSKYFSVSIISVALSLVLGCSMILLLPENFKSTLLPNNLRNHLPFLLMLITVGSYQRILQSFTRGIDKMKVFSITGIVHAVIMLVLAIVLVPKYGLYGFWISLFSADLSSITYTFVAIRGWKYLSIKYYFFSHFREQMKYALP